MAATVKIEIDEEGNPEISVNGVAGKSCKDLTKSIEDAFGSECETKPTREYTQQATDQSRKVGQR